MKFRWLVVAIATGVIALLWMFGSGHVDTSALKRFVGLSPATEVATKDAAKPICSQVIVPAGTDCIPQHLANLPPDPGPAGKLTLEGIDSDKDGTRDDVQRYIASKWGDSARAVKALTMIAQNNQLRVKLGATISEDEAFKLFEQFGNAVHCYVFSVDPKIQEQRALALVETAVTNTPQRFDNWLRFERLLQGRGGLMSDAPLPEICGYDPASLPN